MSDTQPCVFTNDDGERLFGILHLPDDELRRDIAILLLSPGVKMRVAPHRLYNGMAEHLAEQGYPVLRFDFGGLGDSGGEITDRDLATLYGKVQVGLYVGDTRAAMDWMQQMHGIRSFVLAGLCGGAITGLLAARNEPRVAGLFGIGIPVILDDASVDQQQYMTQGQLEGLWRGYVRRLTDWHSWLRMLTLRTDFRMLARAMLASVQRNSAKPRQDRRSAPDPSDNANHLFPEALFAMTENGRPTCFVFSEVDRLYHEFEEKFLARHGGRLNDEAQAFEYHLIEGANHILSSPEHRREMLQIAENWLQRHF